MVESFYDKINDYGSVTIKLASPDDIRSWSYGEVKKAETINYRTYRPEKDGLFCEKIFGPERDWECSCGKYKGIKHKGIICDRCGVKVTHSRVRRKRMGHINLASPVSHIWFFKALPSRMGNLLAVKTSSMERVIYYVDYIVIDPGDTGLEQNQMLSEDEYGVYKQKYGDGFSAGMGAEAIKQLLEQLDLEALSNELREELKTTRSKQRMKEIATRLKTVEMLRESDNQPEWMTLEVVPVIPPELRPLVLLESGNFASSDLNDLYRRLINRNNRLKKLLDLNAPEVIIRNEKRMLQQSVDALFDNARCKRSVVGTAKRPLKSLTDLIKGKQGRFRENLLGKRVDYSGRSVIVVGPELKLHQCGIPKKIALELFQPFIIRKLKEIGAADTIKSAKKMLDRRDEQVWDILDEVIHEHPVLLNRAPTLHRMGIQAFEPVLVEGNAIKIHPLVCAGFNADFDGDQMAVHLPLSIEAQIEASTLMLSVNNIFSPASGKPNIAPSQDIVLGIYYLTTMRKGEKGEGMRFSNFQEVFMAYSTGKIGTHSEIYVKVDAELPVVDERGNLAHKGWFESPDNGKSFTFEQPEEDWVPAEDEWHPNILKTTVGRVLFNDILPSKMPFYNGTIDRGASLGIVTECHRVDGRQATLKFLDDLKELGFKAATRAGISFSKDDLRIPEEKEKIIDLVQDAVDDIQSAYQDGLITDQERYNQIIEQWIGAREDLGVAMMKRLETDTRDGKPYLNPVYIMADSGARGSVDQIRQLAGMRGLMAKPSGDIIETPIKSNFREGLFVLEYFSSTHGARKGLADTALKTADSGYLTRKLADVAQNVVINEHDCGTIQGISKGWVKRGQEIEVTLAQQLYGRVSRDTLRDPKNDAIIVKENQLIDRALALEIEKLGYDQIRVRSPLTCETPLGICASCYGADLSTGAFVEEGMAVGIIAAQSIGEPGTQLTMRTFHIGGVADSAAQESEKVFRPTITKVARKTLKAKVRFDSLEFVPRSELGDVDRATFLGKSAVKKQTKAQRDKDKIVLNRVGTLVITYETKTKNKTVSMEEVIPIPLGALLKIDDGETIGYDHLLAEWDPHNAPVLATAGGQVRYVDIEPNLTMKEETEQATGVVRKVIIPHKGDKHPQINIEDKNGVLLAYEPLPEKAYIVVSDGDTIKRGTLLAKVPSEMSKTQDITGGLPRVTEIFEARKPKNPSVISELDGLVELGKKRRGKSVITIRSETGKLEMEHLVPHGKHLRVTGGQRVKAGDPLVDGPLVPHDILRICGEEALQQYLITEIQQVYRSQSVRIDDKHIEIIAAQMMRKIQTIDPGETSFLPDEVVDKFLFHAENKTFIDKGLKGAQFKPLLLGITKASLSSESFISAASFQETTKVLTAASLGGKVDRLLGLKENVILGHMIPAGTGFKAYYNGRVKLNLPEVSDDTFKFTDSADGEE